MWNIQTHLVIVWEGNTFHGTRITATAGMCLRYVFYPSRLLQRKYWTMRLARLLVVGSAGTELQRCTVSVCLCVCMGGFGVCVCVISTLFCVDVTV